MANPRIYSVQSSNAVASPTKTAGTLTATTAIRPEIFDHVSGSSATPADNALLIQYQRFTAAGTNTSYTPPAWDPGDPAATSVCDVTNTVEPTYTAGQILAAYAMNQRSLVRWILQPTAPMKCPATANNGIGWSAANSSFTGNFNNTTAFNE